MLRFDKKTRFNFIGGIQLYEFHFGEMKTQRLCETINLLFSKQTNFMGRFAKHVLTRYVRKSSKDENEELKFDSIV